MVNSINSDLKKWTMGEQDGRTGYTCWTQVVHWAHMKCVMKKKLSNIISRIVCLCGVLLSALQPANTQILFSENFENDTLSLSWQPVSGNWHMGDVQEMRIAPAENGYTYVLCSNSEGFIRLVVDIPDSIKAGQIKLSFSYYTYSKGPGAMIEVEFHKKDLKDGLKGKMLKFNLPVKGRWINFQKDIKIPAEANWMWIGFSESNPVNKVPKTICFDNIVLSAQILK